MKVGILGGTFNPVHQGHVYISEIALKKLQLNQIWWVITAQNPLKDKTNTTPYKARLEACQKLLKNKPKFFVKDFEKDSYFSCDLISRLKKQYPAHQFYFVMGADNFYQFHRWKNFDLLFKSLRFAVFSRNNDFLKIRKTIAWHKIRQKLDYTKKCQNQEIRSKNAKIRQKTAVFDQKDAKIEQKTNFKKPQILLFKSKNYDLSSTAIRNHN